MLDFFNQMIGGVYRLFVQWLFSYKLSGIAVGWIILACIIFTLVFNYILGRIR